MGLVTTVSYYVLCCTAAIAPKTTAGQVAQMMHNLADDIRVATEISVMADED